MPDYLSTVLGGETETPDDTEIEGTEGSEEVVEGEETETETEGEETEGEETEGEETELTPEEKTAKAAAEAQAKKDAGDARHLPKALKELIAANPTHGKLLKDLYFTNAAYGKFGKAADVQKLHDYVNAYGSLDDAVKIKDTIDALGGPTGLQELQNDYKQYEDFDVKWTAKDPSAVEKLAKTEAFTALMPEMINRYAKDHPEQYDYQMAQVVHNTLAQTGILTNLMLLEQANAAAPNAAITAAINKIKESIGVVSDLSRKAPRVRQVDARSSEIDQERQKLNNQRQQMFITDLKRDTEGWVIPEITKALDSYVKGKTLNAERLTSAVKDEVGKLLSANASFVSKRDALIKQGDKEGLLRLFKQFATPLLPQSATTVAKDFGLATAPKRNKAGQPVTNRDGQPPKSSPGWVNTDKFPAREDVDWDKTTDDMAYTQNRYILKNGNKVRVTG